MTTAEGPRYCGARRTREEGTCRKPAGWGTSHVGAGQCRLHGGATPSGVVAGRRVLAERAVHALGLPAATSAAQALLDEVQRAAGAVEWLSGQIQALSVDELVTPDEGIHVWLRLWHVERDRLVKASAAAIAADVDVRLVRLAEQQGQLLADLLNGIFDDLRLTAEQRARIPEVVPRHLRAVNGGSDR